MIFGREKHTVNGQRPGQWVHESVAPPVSLTPEADVWDPRVKRFKRKRKRKREPRLLGSKTTGWLGLAHEGFGLA